ncbi:hypothetical protein CW355_10545, partial [Haemophilus influenzae]
HNAGNDNCADNAGIEGFNPGHHCQTATCHRVLSEIDAEVASPGHSHRVDKIVPGQETVTMPEMIIAPIMLVSRVLIPAIIVRPLPATAS